MGSPLSPIVANLYMEHFKDIALRSFPLQPKWWKRYVDDTNVCWPHGPEKLEEVHAHRNNFASCISFTKEVESEGTLPFLDILIIKKPNGTLGRRVFRKATHTDRYLHAASHHHPSQKAGIIKSLTLRAFRICDDENLDLELSHLHKVFIWNGYSHKKTSRAFNLANSFSRFPPLPISSPQDSSLFISQDRQDSVQAWYSCGFQTVDHLKELHPPTERL